MTAELERETTEYIYAGITGDLPSSTVETAILPAAQRPIETDWETSILINDDTHPLWADAISSGVTGTYFIGLLIGSFGGNTVVPAPGPYTIWYRITDVTERPVRIAPEALEIL
jgi:hypothetical protein